MELVNLKSIMFNSNDDRAELVVEVKKDSLSYFTSYVINVLQINRILNLVKKNNQGVEVNDLVKTFDFIEFQEYAVDFSCVENTAILKDEIEFYIFNSYQKQIRA
jgi:hypothetical protein